MARKRNYFAASNRGKAGEVFLHNLSANADARRRERAKNAKASAAIERKREKEHARAVAAKLKESQKKERQNERERKQRAKEQEEYDRYMARTKLVCEKFGINEICSREIIAEAYKAGVTVSQISGVLVDGREVHWHEREKCLLEEKYISDLYEKCMETIKQEKVIARLSDDFVSSVISARPDLEGFFQSEVVIDYISRSNLIREQVSARLANHLSNNII